jgi:hypothetical protein
LTSISSQRWVTTCVVSSRWKPSNVFSLLILYGLCDVSF